MLFFTPSPIPHSDFSSTPTSPPIGLDSAAFASSVTLSLRALPASSSLKSDASSSPTIGSFGNAECKMELMTACAEKSAIVTGEVSLLVSVSERRREWNNEEVRWHARVTALSATCVSRRKGTDMVGGGTLVVSRACESHVKSHIVQSKKDKK